MNGFELLKAVSKADYKYLEESENYVPKKKNSFKKIRLTVIAAAAVVGLCGFTYTFYKYNYGNAFTNREIEPGKTMSGDIHDLESTTQPFDGVVLENTFTDIDITIEGIVSEIGSDDLILTAKKKDGTPFAESDEVLFNAALGMCIPYDMIESFKGKEINDASELAWRDGDVHCALNDDGTLSITVTNTWKISNDDHDVILGFRDIAAWRYTEEKDEQYVNFLNSVIDVHNSADFEIKNVEEFNKKFDACKQILRGISDDYYEGNFVVKCHISADEFVISPDENDYGQQIRISGMDCQIRGDSKLFIELAETIPDERMGVDVEVTFKLEDGDEFTDTGKFFCNEIEETNETEAFTSVSFSRFADPYKITEIQINGRTLWKR
ncbi:hypothetical protein [Ruminococcus albus]|uniref:Uncharacterized protein n=1 Tax=Ruminococcus albus TaxID=1264 RepID=A0A1H7GSI3_RUMAL|nr:hypothetical protein [Ruminococcus albus]SEK40994.1 hypothetical protein SAMN05216469_102245 [Ruminococcus albus]